MARSSNHKPMWNSAPETREQRHHRLELRRDRQHALVAGVIAANLLDRAAFDKKTGKPLKRLLSMPRVRVSKYMPHQGAREIARRLKRALVASPALAMAA